MKKVEEYLKRIGLKTIESKIYLRLLATGALNVKDVAERENINRTATYAYISSLLEKGLIIKKMKGSHSHYQAIEPELLYFLIENKYESIRNLDKDFPSIVHTINASIAKVTKDEKVTVTYYKGKSGLDKMYEEAFKSNVLRAYVNLAEIISILSPSDFTMFEKALAKNKTMKIYEIIGNTPESVKKYELDRTAEKGNYYFKFLPSNIGLTTGIFIYDNKVAVLNMKIEISVVILHSEDFYNNSKKLFDFMWQVLPSPSF